MAFQIYLDRVNKKLNSTERMDTSSASNAVTTNINVNDPDTTLLNPTITLSGDLAKVSDGTTDSHHYTYFNYCYIPRFGRYYYINDWQYNADGSWTAYCSVDVLASWKPGILASPAYVNRADYYNGSEFSDSYLFDEIYPSKDQFVCLSNTASSQLEYEFQYGSYVLGIIGNPRDLNGQPSSVLTGRYGTATYFVVTPQQMSTLVGTMTATSDSDWNAISSNSDWLSNIFTNTMKTGINPLQYVMSCKWFPFVIKNKTNTQYRIFLGGWDTGANGYLLSSHWENPYSASGYGLEGVTIDDIGNVDILDGSNTDDPDLDNGHLKAVNYPPIAPYATYLLETPWGDYQLQSNIFSEMFRYRIDERRLKLDLMVDLISGKAIFDVYAPFVAGASPKILRRDIEIGFDIPLTQITKDSLGEIGNYVSIGTRVLNDLPAGVISGIKSMGTDTTAMGNAVRNTMSDIRNIYNFEPTASSTSTTLCAYTPKVSNYRFMQLRFRTVNRAPQLLGKPVKRYYSNLALFSGFLQTSSIELKADCTNTERDMILRYMDGGIFIE